MRRRACAALVAFIVALPHTAWAARAHKSTHSRSHVAARSSRPAKRAPAPSRLEAAKAQLAALARDKSRRRFHHNWDKAIAALLRAARGKDRPAALYEAAKARYAVYRWSADEADREQALKLATQAGKLGVGEARVLARAIHREAGEDDRPAPRHRKHPTPAAVAQPSAEEEEQPDPTLDRVVAALEEDAPAPAQEAGAGPVHVTEIKAWSSADYTRAVIYLSHWVKWQETELPATADQQRRLAVDLSPAVLDGRAVERAVGGGGLTRVRAAQYSGDTVRVVLDLDGDDRVHVFRMDDPPRLVLDLAAPEPPVVATAGPGGDAGGEAATAGGERPDTVLELPPRARALLEGTTPPTTPTADATPPPAPAPASPAPPAAAPRPPAETEREEGDRAIRRIVVDAGHGGHDPGAIGPSRLREKDVTLAIARKLAARLRAHGYEVVLTRNDDRFLALEERTALANTAHGDLFVSVHANASPRRLRNGVETYFLNVTDDRYARRLAARENGVDLDVGGDLARILTDLDAKASADASQRLAHMVQREVCGGVRTRIGDVRDLGVKNALFYVLLGARMPAVLVETGFISNRAEERRLRSSRYQDEVAAGIARAVHTFAGSTDRIAGR
jgi:N-acetylmuramoyl-L-alanine amidase